LNQLKKNADTYGVRFVLIMVDGEGDMSAHDKKERMQAAIAHRKWVDIAHYLGCHAIRCNMGGPRQDWKQDADLTSRSAESFNNLLEYARQHPHRKPRRRIVGRGRRREADQSRRQPELRHAARFRQYQSRRRQRRGHPWVENLNWKCSLNGVKREAEFGLTERNLQALMVEYQIKTEEAHRARADALGMLQLLSRRHAGKTLLAHLLGW